MTLTYSYWNFIAFKQYTNFIQILSKHLSLLDIHLNTFYILPWCTNPSIAYYFWELNFVNFDFSVLFLCLLRCAHNLLIYIWSMCRSFTPLPCAMYSNKHLPVQCNGEFVTGWVKCVGLCTWDYFQTQRQINLMAMFVHY